MEIFYFHPEFLKHTSLANDPCTSSFRHTSYEKLKLSGDVKIYNGTDGLRKVFISSNTISAKNAWIECLDRCVDCDVVIYNEIYSECFVVQLDSTGQALDFVDEEYHVGFKTHSDPMSLPNSDLHIFVQNPTTSLLTVEFDLYC